MCSWMSNFWDKFDVEQTLYINDAWCYYRNFPMFITYCCHSSRLQSSSEIDSCLVLQILHLSTQYCNIYLTGSPLACTFNAVVTTWSQNLDNCLARGESANFWTDVFVMFVATFWNNYCMSVLARFVCFHEYWNAYISTQQTRQSHYAGDTNHCTHKDSCVLSRLFQTYISIPLGQIHS